MEEARSIISRNDSPGVPFEQSVNPYKPCDKALSRFEYEAGAIERAEIKDRVVQILDGTQPAFKNRQSKYRLL
ncbi:MAG: hypothetical protein ACTHMO_11465 [Rhodanobacteraceae bacterium]